MLTKYCFIYDEQGDHTVKITAICEAAGFTVQTCTDLESAETYLADDPPAVGVAFIAIDHDGGRGFTLLDTPALKPAEIIVMADTDVPARVCDAMEKGASYFFRKPFDPNFVKSILADISIQIGLDNNATNLSCDFHSIDQFGHLRGSSAAMHDLYRMLRRVAVSNLSLFVSGESGTGKELVARTAHTLSNRANGPFIAVNCAALADTLIESELFGHEKGSFSGADKRHLGLFECAAGGTLLLDEITEMNPDMQAKLLRVLESRKVRRVGSERDIAVDVRIISTTNRIPEEAVASGKLREDLYFRLAQLPILVPPLRMRGEDIAGLAQYFLNELNGMHSTSSTFEREALQNMIAYHWPGNVRQLRHVVERAYILSDAVIGTGFLPCYDSGANGRPRSGALLEVSLDDSLAESERRIIIAMLKKNGGNKQLTAQTLRISLKTLYNRLSTYEIDAKPNVALAS